MKALVKPRKPMVLVLAGGNMEAFRPSVVVYSDYVSARVASGVVDVQAGELPDSATDADYLKFYKESDGNEDLARDSFVESLKTPEQLEAEAEAKKAAEEAAKKGAKK
jgi:hypothetical protein